MCEREVELVLVGVGVVGHGEAHSTSSGRRVDPRSLTVWVKVTVSPASTVGLSMKPPIPLLRLVGSVTWQVVWPALLPLFVTVSVIARPAPSGTTFVDGRLERSDPGEHEPPDHGEDDDERHDPGDGDAVDLRRRHVAQAERVAALTQPDIERDLGATPRTTMGQAWGGHALMVPRTVAASGRGGPATPRTT